MKKVLFALLLIFPLGLVFAQNNQLKMPVFPGCEEFEENRPLSANCFSEKFSEAITENLNTSFMDETFRRENLKEVKTKIKFQVSKEGKIENVTLVENGDQTLFDQVLIAISKINQKYTLEPAKNGRESMNFWMNLPITYKVPKKTNKQ